MAKKKGFPDAAILAEKTYSGIITPKQLPHEVYYFNAGQLKGAAEKALKIKFSEIDYKTPNFKRIEACRLNIWKFSAAKTFHQQLAMNDALIENKRVIPFADFKEKVAAINDKFNETWLETEYNTAFGQSQMIEQWARFEEQADILPYLQFVTSSGEATCDICAPCDNVTLPVDDDFWDENTPLLHFNCECLLIQVPDEEAKITSAKEADRISEEISPLKHGMFNSNAGKSGIIFNKDVPYFNVPKQYEDFAAHNFGLPIPKENNIDLSQFLQQGQEKKFVAAKTIDEAIGRIDDFGIKVNANSMKLEHLNKTLEAIESVPELARPTSIYDKAGYENNFGRKINRKSSEFQGMALKTEVFDKKSMSYRQEKVLVINSREFKTPSSISERKIKYNEYYSSIKNGDKWYLNTFDGSTHYHEMGHLYDTNISTRKEWVDISHKWHNETKSDMIKVSKGGDFRGENGSEAFAEAFASYFGNNKIGLPNYIIEFFEKNIK